MNPPGDTPDESGRPDYGSRPGPDPSGYSDPAGYPGQPGQPGASGPQQGRQQPPHQPPYGAPGPGPAAPPPAAGPNFVTALFDFEFRSFVTTRITKVLFVLGLVLIAISTLSGIVGSFDLISHNALAGLLALLGALVGGAVSVLLTRVVLEVLIVLFRISEHLAALRARSGM
ncbi:DUF4282 domain-containing protein [Streptomonospora salina]|uniref:DUF4282 domain-containing protein n=1 Tax=Streptomonospora salina TaxID=104205 RepID=A0A841EGR7_9ACTN|nr:DUF4282 domain-containing protein [Streptomonospora salina]MBB6000559.1 hypothetical protein [Streptomonospora salina]